MSTLDALPFHLRGNFAPVRDEVTAFDLPVVGAIPRRLRGRYIRNGPNPKTGTSHHWFVGDGMFHGVELRDGRAVWYRNRWVSTRSFVEDAKMLRDDYTKDITVGLANTHVIAHAGRILALVETSLPTGMTAHPKRCPAGSSGTFRPAARAASSVKPADAKGGMVNTAEARPS